MDNNTITVGDFNTPPTSMNISFREKIHKETLALNQMVLTYIEYYIQRHQNTPLFKCTWNILQDKPHNKWLFCGRPQNKSP